MSDRNITLFAYHSHGDGPRILSDLFGGQAAEEVEEIESSDDDGGRSLGPLLALVALVALAAGYRYYRSRSGDEPGETEQVEVTEYES